MSTIAIIGYRGSGKTTISQWIAEHLDMPCIDTDERVLEHLGVSIQSEWDEEEEARWREVEAEIVPSLLKEDAVVSMGGASPMPEVITEALKQVSLVINCIADEETTLARIEKGEDRTISHAMLHADALQVRSERLEIYGSVATHELDTNGDLALVIPRIQAVLQDRYKSR
jgi:shikimate kinase